MIKNKTAVLLGASLAMGALASDINQENNALKLYQIGINLGIGFQLQDDYLDAFGDPDKFGKKVGGDIAQHKKTYLWLKAHEIANTSQLQRLETAKKDSQESSKIQAVLDIYEELGIPDYTLQLVEEYYRQSISSLDAVNAPQDRKQPLYDLARQLMDREN